MPDLTSNPLPWFRAPHLAIFKPGSLSHQIQFASIKTYPFHGCHKAFAFALTRSIGHVICNCIIAEGVILVLSCLGFSLGVSIAATLSCWIIARYALNHLRFPSHIRKVFACLGFSPMLSCCWQDCSEAGVTAREQDANVVLVRVLVLVLVICVRVASPCQK